jgi:hypothetical protein
VGIKNHIRRNSNWLRMPELIFLLHIGTTISADRPEGPNFGTLLI